MDYEDVTETIGEVKGGTEALGVNLLFRGVGKSRIGATRRKRLAGQYKM